MQLAHRWADRNLTRLELVIALIVIMIIFGTFTRHVLIIFARAEMRMVDSTIINLNSSIKYHAAVAVMREDYAQLSRMEGMNPMGEIQLLQDSYIEVEEHIDLIAMTSEFPVFTRPLNYIGELNNPDSDIIGKGEWYFDIDARTLNYRVRNHEFFINGLTDDSTISFKVNINYVDRDANGKYDPEHDEFVSINVKNINDYGS